MFDKDLHNLKIEERTTNQIGQVIKKKGENHYKFYDLSEKAYKWFTFAKNNNVL